jgi:hypothetical protein
VAKKQDEVKKAIGGIVLGNDQEPEKDEGSGYTVASVGLTADQAGEIDKIAEELGQSRHAVMKYAVLDFVRRYKAGERPEYKTVKVLDTST